LEEDGSIGIGMDRGEKRKRKRKESGHKIRRQSGMEGKGQSAVGNNRSPNGLGLSTITNNDLVLTILKVLIHTRNGALMMNLLIEL
jgi:hypothetical protein